MTFPILNRDSDTIRDWAPKLDTLETDVSTIESANADRFYRNSTIASNNRSVTSTGTYTDIADCQETITGAVGDLVEYSISGTFSHSTGGDVIFRIYQDSTGESYENQIRGVTATTGQGSGFCIKRSFTLAAAGSTTFKVACRVGSGTGYIRALQSTILRIRP